MNGEKFNKSQKIEEPHRAEDTKAEAALRIQETVEKYLESTDQKKNTPNIKKPYQLELYTQQRQNLRKRKNTLKNKILRDLITNRPLLGEKNKK